MAVYASIQQIVYFYEPDNLVNPLDGNINTKHYELKVKK